MADANGKLAEWQQRTDEATAGPWHTYLDPMDDSVSYGVSSDGSTAGYNLGGGELDTADGLIEEDAEFVVAAREAMPKLLAAIDGALELHSSTELHVTKPGCRECAEDYPCRTVRRLNAALGTDSGSEQ